MPALPQGALELVILQTLAKGPRHGYAIARWIEQTTDDVLGVEEGALYPALYRLQQRKLIRADWARSEFRCDGRVKSSSPSPRETWDAS